MNFNIWLSKQLRSATNDIVAYCFNLYETDDESIFDVQVVGSKEYTPDDNDWPCHICFSSGDNVYSFHARDWEDALAVFKIKLLDYLQSEECCLPLKYTHIAFGFVDGDLEYLC